MKSINQHRWTHKFLLNGVNAEHIARIMEWAKRRELSVCAVACDTDPKDDDPFRYTIRVLAVLAGRHGIFDIYLRVRGNDVETIWQQTVTEFSGPKDEDRID